MKIVLREGKNKPCCVCGLLFHFSAMDYDHIDPALKTLNVSKLITYSLAKLSSEISKCNVICACCHRIRTWNDKHHNLGVRHELGSCPSGI